MCNAIPGRRDGREMLEVWVRGLIRLMGLGALGSSGEKEVRFIWGLGAWGL